MISLSKKASVHYNKAFAMAHCRRLQKKVIKLVDYSCINNDGLVLVAE
jgi:hypothetical protein